MIGVLILASALAYMTSAVLLAAEVRRASGDSVCCAGSVHSEALRFSCPANRCRAALCLFVQAKG